MSRKHDSEPRYRKPLAIAGVLLAGTTALAGCGESGNQGTTQPNGLTSTSASPNSKPAQSNAPEVNTNYNESEIISNIKDATSGESTAKHIASLQIAKDPALAKELGAGPLVWQANIDDLQIYIKAGDTIKKSANPDSPEWGWYSFNTYFLAKSLLPLMESGLQMAKENHINDLDPKAVSSKQVGDSEASLMATGITIDLAGRPKLLEYGICTKNLAAPSKDSFSPSSPENSGFSTESLALKKQVTMGSYNVLKQYVASLDLPCK